MREITRTTLERTNHRTGVPDLDAFNRWMSEVGTDLDDETRTWLGTLAREVGYLRRVLAREARVIEAQTDLKAIRGSRRRILDEQVERLRAFALGLDVYPHETQGKDREYDTLLRAYEVARTDMEPDPDPE